MKTKIEYTFNLPKKVILEKYSSTSYYEDRLAFDGVENYKITRGEENTTKSTIEISRQTQIKTEKLPKLIKKIADNLVGGSANLITTIEWNKKTGKGSNIIRAQGVPVTLTVHYSLTEKSKGQCLAKAEVEINARIPIVGKQLEKFMLPKAAAMLEKDFARTEKLLVG